MADKSHSLATTSMSSGFASVVAAESPSSASAIAHRPAFLFGVVRWTRSRATALAFFTIYVRCSINFMRPASGIIGMGKAHITSLMHLISRDRIPPLWHLAADGQDIGRL